MKAKLASTFLAAALLTIGCTVAVVDEPEPKPAEPLPGVVRTVGAHYYPWYGAPAHDWQDGEWSKESPSTPVLGNYNSTDPSVIEQHIEWAHMAGISWFNVSWWGPDHYTDTRLKDVILQHPRAGEMEWSVVYETIGRLGDWPVDMDDPTTRSRFCEDLEYLAVTYFDRDIYKKIDGRPVLYIYVARSLQGDVVEAYEEAVELAGIRPYLIVDIWLGATPDTAPIIGVADAVTTYIPYVPRDDIEDVFLQHMEQAYRAWYIAQEHHDFLLIPTTASGFDDSQITHVHRDNPVLTPSPDRYEQASRIALMYADGPVIITSFNEWYEDTQVEPSEEFGEAYLRITADILATGEREPPEIVGDTLALVFEKLVLESELNPAVENGRSLAMLIRRIIIRDTEGDELVNIDVGGCEGDALFIAGAYFREFDDDMTWRWFGGNHTTVIHLPAIPEAGTLELEGWAATQMSVSLVIAGEYRGEATIGKASAIYGIEF